MNALTSQRRGMCVECGAQRRGCSREQSLKATKELIANGLALTELDHCAVCHRRTPLIRLRHMR